MNRNELIPYIGHCLDDALAVRKVEDMPTNAVLCVWQCGFEPMVVAVWSYLGVQLTNGEAEEIAMDYLTEIEWFVAKPQSADYIVGADHGA